MAASAVATTSAPGVCALTGGEVLARGFSGLDRDVTCGAHVTVIPWRWAQAMTLRDETRGVARVISGQRWAPKRARGYRRLRVHDFVALQAL